MGGYYVYVGSNLEKYGKFWKNGRFSGRIWPDWRNTAWADMAGLGSIGLKGCTHRAMILCDKAADKAIERSKLKPLHSGNTSLLRFTGILDVKQTTETTCDCFRLISNMPQIFPLQWACFSITTSSISQWVHLFSVYFDYFSTIYLI